jgi:hypothetical protein
MLTKLSSPPTRETWALARGVEEKRPTKARATSGWRPKARAPRGQTCTGRYTWSAHMRLKQKQRKIKTYEETEDRRGNNQKQHSEEVTLEIGSESVERKGESDLEWKRKLDE